MNYADYTTRFGPRGHLPSPARPDGLLADGFLLFTEDTAHRWAGPYPGGFARYTLNDCRKVLAWKDRLQLESRVRADLYRKRVRVLRAEALYSKTARAILRDLTPELINLEGTPTLDNPCRLRLAGNDDTTYTACYPTEEAAREVLGLLEECQPLAFGEVVFDFGFEFTN